MAKLKVKQIRLVTYVLGVIAALLLGILGFRFLGDFLTSRATNIAPQNVAITNITQSAANVKWSTDRESQSVIEYGTTPTSLTFFAPEATQTKDHRIELNLLTPTTTYYFQIKTGDQVFDNGGVPWTFTTLAEGENKVKKETTNSEPIEPEPTIQEEEEAFPTTEPEETIPNTESTGKDTDCNKDEYKNRLFTNEPRYDQDDNGIVNALDWVLCVAKNSSDTTDATPTEAVEE